MDQAKASAIADRLVARFSHEVIPSGPPESLYLRPLIHLAKSIAHEELAGEAVSAEAKIVVRATCDNLDRILAERTARVDEPIIGTPEAASLLRAAVAGRGLSPA
jgi:hypothetical protein